MAYALSTLLKRISSKSNLEPIYIIDIPDLGVIYGSRKVQRVWKVGDAVKIGDPGLKVGGLIIDPTQRDWIELKKTNTVFSQQLLQDRGSSGSITRVKFRLVDKKEEVTKYFSPGQIVEEPINIKCSVYQSFVGGSHPRDSILLMNGSLTDIDYGAGHVDLLISAPESKKKVNLFTKATTNLTSNINDSVLSIPVETINGFFLPQDVLKTFILIDEEIIEYNVLNTGEFVAVQRGAFGTTPAAHDSGASVKSLINLVDNPIYMALKLLMSGSGIFASDVETSTIGKTDPFTIVQNSIFFQGIDVKEKYGLVENDLVSSVATNPNNTFTDRKIIDFGTNDNGSWIVVDGANLDLDTDPDAVLSFQSQFDTLPNGCAMDPTLVDVQQHLDIYNLVSTGLPTLDFREVNTIKAKDFINQQVYYPSGLYEIPRKGKTSVNIVLPPIASRDTKFLDSKNVRNASDIKIKRSINTLFYNEINYSIDYNPITDKFDREVPYSVEASSRISTGSKPLEIESRGLRSSDIQFINRRQRAYASRYGLGAESLDVEVLYGQSFDAEIGDTVIFGDEFLKISDTTTGNRKFRKRIMEIQNSRNDVRNAKVDFSLVDTAYGINARYGIISPASIIDQGSTLTNLILKRSYGTKDTDEENEKWQNLIDEIVLIHNPDWSIQKEAVFKGFALGQPNTMVVEGLDVLPNENWIVRAPNYSGARDHKEKWKLIYPSFNPQVAVVSAANSTEIDVGANVSYFFVGSIIRVHNYDFTVDTGADKIIKVKEINGNIITVDDLGFTPTSDELIDGIGFVSDSGDQYRYF